MPRYADEITALLRAMVWGEELRIEPAVLLEPGLWAMARRQQMAHMLAVWAMNKGLAIPEPTQKKMQIFMSLQRRQRQNQLLTDLVTLLRGHKIEPVLLKGFGLSQLYSNPDMRDFGDVDLYIGERDYDRMISIVRAAYPDAFQFYAEEGWLHFVMVLDENQDRVAELHRVTMELPRIPRADRAFQQFTLQEMMHPEAIDVNGVQVSVPSKRYNALYVFMHAWAHFASGSGVGLRQIADWMLALHVAAGDKRLETVLRPLLEQMHMLDIWQTFGWVAVNYLGMPREELPLYTDACARRGQRLYYQLMVDGHRGREMRLGLFGRQMYSYPFARPQHCRLCQRIDTFCRIHYNAWQLAKLFPHYAWLDFTGEMRIKLKQKLSSITHRK